MGRDETIPIWVQHIAFELKLEKALIEAWFELEKKGMEVLGVYDHTIIKSFVSAP